MPYEMDERIEILLRVETFWWDTGNITHVSRLPFSHRFDAAFAKLL